MASLRSGLKAGRGIVAAGDSGYEPLCACYPLEALDFLRRQVQSGQNKLQTILTLLVENGLMAVRALSPSEQVVFFNLNTPEDIARIEA